MMRNSSTGPRCTRRGSPAPESSAAGTRSNARRGAKGCRHAAQRSSSKACGRERLLLRAVSWAGPTKYLFQSCCLLACCSCNCNHRLQTRALESSDFFFSHRRHRPPILRAAHPLPPAVTLSPDSGGLKRKLVTHVSNFLVPFALVPMENPPIRHVLVDRSLAVLN